MKTKEYQKILNLKVKIPIRNALFTPCRNSIPKSFSPGVKTHEALGESRERFVASVSTAL